MVITCQQCSARLQLDDTKVPSRPFTVRCPKCQQSINAQPAAPAAPAGDIHAAQDARSVRPAPAAPFQIEGGVETEPPPDALRTDRDEIAQLLSALLQRAMSTAATEASKTPLRRAWDHRRALVCATPDHRFGVARVLVEGGFEVFVAEDTTQAIERMREDKMDIVLLDPKFDELEQGAAFIRREVTALRPAARRRLFFVILSPEMRSGDQHLAFVNHANLAINPADVEDLPTHLERTVRDFNELYRDFNKAMQVATL